MLLSIMNITFDCLGFLLIFLNPLTEKIKLRHYVFLSLLLFLVELVQLKYNFSTLFVIGAAFLYMLLLTKNKLLNSILALFCYFAAVVISNLSVAFLQKVFHINVKTLTTSYVAIIPFNLYFLLLVFLLTSLIGRYAKKHLRPDSFNRYQKLFSLVLIEILLAVAVLILNIDYVMQQNYPNEIIIYNCILFFLYFLLSTLLLINIVQTTRRNMEAEQKEMEYNHLLDYIKDLEQTSNTLRKFRHDYLNTLLTMDLMIKTRNLEQLADYFEEHIKPESRKVSKVNMTFTGLSHIMDPAVKGIISHKLQMARLHNIAVRVDIQEDIPDLRMEAFDLARILGFFLDNAIEAASDNIDSPYIEVSFVPMEECLTIIVENSCQPDDIPLERLSEEGFSTKGDNRGFGLHQVEEILSTYPYVHHLMQKDEDLFSQTLEIYPE